MNTERDEKDLASLVHEIDKNSRKGQLKTTGRQLNQRNHRLQLYFRYVFPVGVLALLIGQTVALYNFMFTALENGTLENAGMVLSIAFPASLGQTYFILQMIVKWIFSYNSTLDDKREEY